MSFVPTPSERLKALAACSDAVSLKSALHEPNKRLALCFLRLESAAQERELMSSLGVSRFGSEVLVVVDFLP